MATVGRLAGPPREVIAVAVRAVLALSILVALIAVAGIGIVAQAEPQIVATSKAFLFSQPVCYAPCEVAFEARLDGPVAVTPDGLPAVLWHIKPAEPAPGEIQTGERFVGTSFLHRFEEPGAYLVIVSQVGADGTIQEARMTITVLEPNLTARLLKFADTVLKFLMDVLKILPIRIIVGG